ncbi:hypothetical protein M422DRAFT_269963 [Sphaerobolus stellatus SS14]|uniref:Uncharacterized protein n=1 Tax=Sphaerobolus stellatus (strain SS14) TaxID=990650 RepID=A0A0C9UTW3_SPHS4|nr:hypothetical protein M422DRAFT_269963 [Sphaerobolus stellatus SS14]
MSRQGTHVLEGREGKDEMRKGQRRQEGKDEMRKWSCMNRQSTHKLGREGKDEMRIWSLMSRQGTHNLEDRRQG